MIMSGIYRVLLATNSSSSWRTPAAVWQIMMVRSCVEVTLLHVLDDGWHSGRDRKLAQAVTRLEGIARQDLPGVRVVCRIERGRAADRILECIRETHIDLVVMPEPDGETAAQVFLDAPCAVWLAGAPAGPSVSSSLRVRTICCSIDGGDTDEHVLQEAARLASDLGARLTIVNALWAEPGQSTAPLCDAYVRRREIQSAEVRIDKLRRQFAPEADLRVEVGIRETVLRQAIQSQDAGLLVTGGRASAAILAAELTCPVWRVALQARSVTILPLAQAVCAGQ
jgi:nucleotide-binding universal stress UspA family protein